MEAACVCRPVTRDNWGDFEAFFLSYSILRYCWCMEWRLTREELKQNDTASRKAYMRQRIMDNVPVGILAYQGGAPVAWCSVGPRESFRNLKGNESLEGVWSVTCFFVPKDRRGQGLTRALIDGAIDYARENGAQYLEGYPVERDSPSYRHMGQRSMFERAGFAFVKDAGLRRRVMTLKLR
jgi:GNAT superfamily N-acetyltransferase